MMSRNINREIICVLVTIIAFSLGLYARDGTDLPEKEFQRRLAHSLFEKLLRIPSQVTVLQVSSHNKKGLNGDENWPLYRDEHGDDVIPAEVETFTGKEDRSALLDSFAWMGETPFESLKLEPYLTETETIEPGQTVSLLKLENTAGIIREILIESDGAEDFFQKTWLRMRLFPFSPR